MTDCPGDGERAMSPMELYEKLTTQGDQVRSLKNAKADKVSLYLPCTNGLCRWVIWYLTSQMILFLCFHNAEIFTAH